MMNLDQEFAAAASDYKNINARLSNDELNEVYALYSQATVGDAIGPALRPTGARLREVPRVRFADLSTIIEGTDRRFLVLALDDKLHLIAERVGGLEHLGSGVLPAPYTAIVSVGDAAAVSYGNTVVIMKVLEVDGKEVLVKQQACCFEANISEVSFSSAGILIIITKNSVSGFAGPDFDTADFVVSSKEDNIVSAMVSSGKFYILISGGDLLSIQLSGEVMELDDAELEVPNVNDVFFGQDKGYVFTDGQVVTLGDSQTQVSGATLDPDKKLHQMNSSKCVAFMQGAELYFMPRDDVIRKITLQKSKIAGRETLVTYTYFADHFIVFSADYCISMVTVDGDRTKSAVLAFLCPYCGNIFKDWHKLHRDHIHLHKGPVSCGICGPKIDKYQYLEHKSSCKFTCVDCGKQFDRENRFIAHKRIHSI